jgi:copper oxidase (laccase) domain-containing protein
VTEAFSFLDTINAIPGIRAGWIERIPGLPLHGNRDEAMKALRPFHAAAVSAFAGNHAEWWRAEQVHGAVVAKIPNHLQITAPDGLPVVPEADGLITTQTGCVLSIYTADCGAIWLADRGTGAIGLLHSGKKGTEGNILGNALRSMTKHYGTRPQDVVAVLSPCIRRPDYEVEIADEIRHQAEDSGVGHFVDCGLNTAADLARFYSYRKELGKTGRMMAMIVRDPLP